MRPFQIDVDPINVSTTGIAAENSSSGATVTLDGSLTSGGSFTAADGLGHRISIIDAGAEDQAAATFTLTGTDADDNALTEALTGPESGATVTSTGYYKTLTSVAVGSPVSTSTVDIGVVDEVETRVYPIDYRSSEGAGIGVIVTGTIDYTVEETFNNVLSDSATDDFVDIAALADKTAELGESATVGATGIRVVVNSYTDTAELQVNVSQR